MFRAREWSLVDEGSKDLVSKHMASVPVGVGAIARDLGLKVLAATLPVGVSGEIRPGGIGAGFTIKVNRHDSPARQRFTVAHEIAHFLLHREQIGSGISDDVLYRSSLSDQREAEANRLAADILMPDPVIERFRHELSGQSDESIVTTIANSLNVSEAAVAIRLGIR